MVTTLLSVTVDVAPEDLSLLKHELVEVEGVLTVLDALPTAGDSEILKGLVAAAGVAADHYRDEAEYFEREGEREAAASFANSERGVRDLIAKSSWLSPASDPLLVKIQQLLDDDLTGVVRDTLWDIVENS